MTAPTYVPFEIPGPVPLLYADFNAHLREALEEGMASMEKGTVWEPCEGVSVRRTEGETGRFKLRVEGQRTRTVTGAKATARKLLEVVEPAEGGDDVGSGDDGGEHGGSAA